MSITIKYAYLHHQTWLYRRHYPKDVKVILGATVLKQTLKTSDVKLARKRVAELNTQFDHVVETARTGAATLDTAPALTIPKISSDATQEDIWQDAAQQIRAAIRGERSRISPIIFSGVSEKVGKSLVKDLAWTYLRKRSTELRWGGYKSVRYSVGLLSSKYGDRAIGSLCREDGREFLSLIEVLSRLIGKSERSRGLSLDQLVAFSSNRNDHIKPKTQKRLGRKFSSPSHRDTATSNPVPRTPAAPVLAPELASLWPLGRCGLMLGWACAGSPQPLPMFRLFYR